MSELKSCPFCGGAVSKCDESPLYGGSIMHDETECLFKNNLLFHGNIAERWNSRPLEDALQARIAELEKELRIYDEAIRDCAIDRSLGGNRPVFEYIADARKNLPAPPEEVSNET